MKTISDLPRDLVGEILSRVPITSLREVRCTCKGWNALSKHDIFGKKAAAAATKQFLGFMIMDYRVCSLRFNLQGIIHKEFAGPSIKQIGDLNEIEMSKAFHCDGLVLCATKDNTRLLVWNPYMGQKRWIEPKTAFHRLDRYALGYDQNNKSYKILRFVDNYLHDTKLFQYEIYDLNSTSSWRSLDVTPDWDIEFYRPGMSCKGNTYFYAKEKIGPEGNAEVDGFLLCFDFTKEIFGPRLHVPFFSYFPDDAVSISCVGEERLAVLYQCLDLLGMEIWVTTSIAPDMVSWSKLFLAVDIGFRFHFIGASFFLDEEKKLAVVFNLDESDRYKIAYVIGEDGYVNKLNLGDALNLGEYPYGCPLVCPYVPSLVEINKGL